MAKKTRYGNRPRPAAKRAAKPAAPGSGAAAPRPATPPAPAAPFLHGDHMHDADEMPMRTSSALTEAEIERAAQLEAEATAKERAVIAESLRRKAKAQAQELEREHGVAADINAPLSVRAAHEYAYVARDVKRIALTASLMVAILAVLHILVNVMGVITL
jgi:hypothetical protein